jgi:ABC-type xylose transport system permease subunit
MNYKNNQIVVEIKIIKTTIKKNKTMSILERINAPTPKFFRVLRNIGLCLVAAGGVLVATPIAIPAAIVALGGYLIVAGSVATVVAQTAVEKNNK